MYLKSLPKVVLKKRLFKDFAKTFNSLMNPSWKLKKVKKDFAKTFQRLCKDFSKTLQRLSKDFSYKIMIKLRLNHNLINIES